MSARRSIRLPDYDYAQEGAYFITICIQHKEHRLGYITNDTMYLSSAGEMVRSWWEKLPEKFSDIELGAYIIMPNHFHGIIINVGATPRGRPKTGEGPDDLENDAEFTQSQTLAVPGMDLNATTIADTQTANGRLLADDNWAAGVSGGLGDHVGSPLREIVGWFKTMTTNEYIRNVRKKNWPPFDKRLWQRNYYEHIIRTDLAFKNITTYIFENPQRWKTDRLYS